MQKIILGSLYLFHHPTISKSKATSFSHNEKTPLRKHSKFQVEDIPSISELKVENFIIKIKKEKRNPGTKKGNGIKENGGV